MAEPVIQAAATGVSLITVATAVAGPLAGPYLVIALGGLSGGLWALSSTSGTTRLQGAMLMLRCMFMAVLLTSIIAQVLGVQFGIQTTELYGLVSLGIGMLGNRWQGITDALYERVRLVIVGAGKPNSGDKP